MLFRSLSLLPLAIAGIAAEAVNFDGHQAFRIVTDGDAASVTEKLAAIDYNRWSYGAKDHIDISVSGDDVETFKKLGLEFKQMHKDLGADIREEKKWKPYRGKYHHGEFKDLALTEAQAKDPSLRSHQTRGSILTIHTRTTTPSGKTFNPHCPSRLSSSPPAPRWKAAISTGSNSAVASRSRTSKPSSGTATCTPANGSRR